MDKRGVFILQCNRQQRTRKKQHKPSYKEGVGVLLTSHTHIATATATAAVGGGDSDFFCLHASIIPLRKLWVKKRTR